MGIYCELKALKPRLLCLSLPFTNYSHVKSIRTNLRNPSILVSFLNGATSEVMLAPEVPYFHRLRRSKLRALLTQGLNLVWNKRLRDVIYQQDEKNGFEDGQHITGRSVIDADRAGSMVRRLLHGPESSTNTRLPCAATSLQARFSQEKALFLRSFHPLFLAAPHPNNQFAFFGLQDAPAPDESESRTLFFYISWNLSIETQNAEIKVVDNAARLRQVKEMGKEYAEP